MTTTISLTMDQFQGHIREVAFPWPAGFFRILDGSLYYFSEQVDISYTPSNKFCWTVRNTRSSLSATGYSLQEAWAKYLRA